MPHLPSRSDIKGFPRIDKPYLLRFPCSKPMLMVKMSPIISIAVLENHLHVIHVTLQHLFSPHDEVISDWKLWKRTFLQRSIWQRLGYMTAAMYKGHCFLIGCTTEFLIADVVKSMGRRSSDSSQIAWGNCPKPRLELTNHLANTYKVAWSDVGVSLLRTIRPSPWNFVKFYVRPSQVTMCNGK